MADSNISALLRNQCYAWILTDQGGNIMPTKNRIFFRGALIGAALGIGALTYREYRNRKNPLGTPAQRRINSSLERTLEHARLTNRLPLGLDAKYIVFSDLHKGCRDMADDFQPCEPTYLAALNYYHQFGYSLVLLGDVEELWENEISKVMRSYANVLEAEKAFYPERYIRIVGNHDDSWNNPALVNQYLAPYYPDLRMQTGMVLDFDDGEQSGEIFLAHGHQGTLDSELFAGFSQRFLPIYRMLQNLADIGHTTPATNSYLRSLHDTRMYRWSSRKGKLILVAGHTHRPVWTSLTHLDQLYLQLFALTLYKDRLDPAEYTQQRQRLLEEISLRERLDPPLDDILKTRPSYFNTGCCRFRDGDITGMEITGSEIRLIRWSKLTLGRQELASIWLHNLFAQL
jgi:UDP-2,3-diacylglucosamine pyrophosphatase LpxH